MTEPAEALRESSVDRFGQLTYSSFDTGDGRRGGWQVKEVRGLHPQEVEELTARIATRMDIGPVDRFLTPDQIGALPRRLVYGSTVHGAGYWHTVPAGVDGSGRPGNVFAHVLLDRRPDARDMLRPIDLWRSPDWLTPYNPDGVLAARLPGVPRPRTLMPSADRALRFLRDPEHWRFGALPGLLDAVAAALVGGPSVVLGVADPEHAAAWIAVVSRFTSPGTARRLGFSTLETAGSVPAVVATGAHLVCVRREDLEALAPRRDLVLIDEDEFVETGALGGDPHVTASGSRIAVTPWSGLAEALLDDPDRTPELLAQLDAIALDVGDRSLPTSWPAAAVVLLNPVELVDGREDALVAVLEDAPSSTHASELHSRLEQGIRATADGDAARVWAMVSRARSWTDSATSRLVARIYLEGALADPAWLTARDPAPLPPLAVSAASSLDNGAIVDAVLGVHERSRQPGADRDLLAVECLRMVDLVFRWQGDRWPSQSGGDVTVLEQLSTAVRELVVPHLFETARARTLVGTVGPLSGPTVARLLRPLVQEEMERRRQHDTSELGERLPEVVVEWLVAPLDERPAPMGIVEALTAVDDVDGLQAEWVMHRRTEASAEGVQSWDRLALVLGLAESVEAFRRRGVVRTIPSALTGSLRLTVDELALLTDRFGHLVPAELCLPVLVAEPSSPELVGLCRRLAPRAWEDDVVGVAATAPSRLERLVRLRAAVHRSTWWASPSRQVVIRRAEVVYELAAWAGRLHADVELAAEVVCHAQAAWVVIQIPGQTRVGAEPSAAVLDRVLVGAGADELVSLVAGQLEPPVVVGLAALATAGSPLEDLEVMRRLAAARVDLDGVVAPALEHAARLRLGDADDVAALTRTAVEFGRGFVESLAVDVPGERLVRWEKFAQGYLRAMSPKQGVLHATLGRLRRG